MPRRGFQSLRPALGRRTEIEEHLTKTERQKKERDARYLRRLELRAEQQRVEREKLYHRSIEVDETDFIEEEGVMDFGEDENLYPEWRRRANGFPERSYELKTYSGKRANVTNVVQEVREVEEMEVVRVDLFGEDETLYPEWRQRANRYPQRTHMTYSRKKRENVIMGQEPTEQQSARLRRYLRRVEHVLPMSLEARQDGIEAYPLCAPMNPSSLDIFKLQRSKDFVLNIEQSSVKSKFRIHLQVSVLSVPPQTKHEVKPSWLPSWIHQNAERVASVGF